MQFRLRTIFIIITTVALYTAIHVALYQSVTVPGLSASRGVYATVLLPLFLLWIVAACWIYEHRQSLESYRLVLFALLLASGWRISSEAIYTLGYRSISSSGPGMPWIFTVTMIIEVTVRFTCWSLLLLAFIRANRARQEAVATAASPWLPDEPATT